MDSLPILFMSKEAEGREHIAAKTIGALKKHLITDLPLKFYLCVAGSQPYFDAIVTAIGNNYMQIDNRVFLHKDTAGKAWNFTLHSIFEDGHELLLRMEDDFLLKDDLDINTYVELLKTNHAVGMVRLGLMPINLKLFSVGWYDSMNQGHIFFDCLPTTPYAYSGNPGLIHKRLHDAVGYFHEEHNPGDIEIDFSSRS